MKNILIITVGTSILYNPQNILSSFLSQEKQTTEYEDLKFKLKNHFTQNQEVLLKNNISAELTMIHSLLKEKQLAEKTTVYLLHSDTQEGRFSAQAIEIILDYLLPFFKCELVSILGLNMMHKSLKDVQKGLINFVGDLNMMFEKMQPVKDYIIFSPIGGYKSLTMLSHMVASIYQISCWYQFENTKFTIQIPHLPLSIDSSFFLNDSTKKLLKQIYLSNHFNFREIISMDIENINEAVALNHILFYTLEDAESQIVSISPLVLNQLEELEKHFLPEVYFKTLNADLNKQVYEKFLAAWRTDTSTGDFKNTFRHELDLKLNGANNNWHVFRAKKGDSLRAVFSIDYEQSIIFISDVMTHKEYDDLLKNSKQRKLFKSKLEAALPADMSQYTKYINT